MRTYFAGVPGGNQPFREAELENDGVKNRLITFYYTHKSMCTLEFYGKVPVNRKDFRDWGRGARDEA